SAQVRTDSVFTHRLFRDLTRGQSGALGPRERGVRANRVTRGLVTERCSTVSWCRSKGDLGEQRPARAKRVRQGGGGHQDGFENERKGNADALDFSLIAQVAMTGEPVPSVNVSVSSRSRLQGPRPPSAVPSTLTCSVASSVTASVVMGPERGALPSIQLQYRVVPSCESSTSKVQGLDAARSQTLVCDWATT